VAKEFEFGAGEARPRDRSIQIDEHFDAKTLLGISSINSVQ